MGTQGRDQAPRLITDTTEFFDVKRGDVLMVGGESYLIRGHAREGRFGLDDEIKPWVKTGVDLGTGRKAIIKLVFYEKFDIKVGKVSYTCYRSPKKEARIIELVKGRRHFMQGRTFIDEAGNHVRVLDVLPGPSLTDQMGDLEGMDHERYAAEHLPALLADYIEVVEAIGFLHKNGEKHGDVRHDHLMRDAEGRLAWIDFDYNYLHGENIASFDLVGLGNVLAYVVGGGQVTLRRVKKENPAAIDHLDTGDLNLIFKNRVMNLGKVYDHLPRSLNYVLMHFCAGAELFYEDVPEMAADLRAALDDLK